MRRLRHLELFENYSLNENIEDKDWKRMKDLIQKNSEGEGVAATLRNKKKAINRFVAGLLLSGETGLTFGIKHRNIIDKDDEYRDLPFKEFGNKALELGATVEEIQKVYDNTEVPQKYKDLTDHAYLSSKKLNSWVTGKVSKAILDAGYDINYLNKGGNALTYDGKDAMRRSGRKWTIGYKTEIVKDGKSYGLDFDAITSEAVDDTNVKYVVADTSHSIFFKYIDSVYGIREFTRNIIKALDETKRPTTTLGSEKNEEEIFEREEYLPYYTVKDLDNMRKTLKSKGFSSYTPDEVKYKYSEEKAVVMVTNAAGDFYGKDVENLLSAGENLVEFTPEWLYPKTNNRTEKMYNEDIFLVVPYKKNGDFRSITNILDKKKYIDFKNDKNLNK